MLLFACKGREAACRERCGRFGITAPSEQCGMLCTTSCDALKERFAVSDEMCRFLKTGEERAAH